MTTRTGVRNSELVTRTAAIAADVAAKHAGDVDAKSLTSAAVPKPLGGQGQECSNWGTNVLRCPVRADPPRRQGRAHRVPRLWWTFYKPAGKLISTESDAWWIETWGHAYERAIGSLHA